LILSPPEKALLGSIAHLSDIHYKVLTYTSAIPTAHTSSICRAVATSIRSSHLSRFQQKVLEVEDGILRRDAGSVGAYNIVPLTFIVEQFSDWHRRMEWYLEITQFIMKDGCTGAQLINKLCDTLQTGYTDIEVVALQLVKVAETAWLKQVSAWILYGRLPPFGGKDFFVQQGEDGDAQEYVMRKELLPEMVNLSTASSILFIGRSLNHIRAKGVITSGGSLGLLPSHLQMLSSLTFPISTSSLSGVISAIRLSLSQSALQQLLPLSKIQEILALLHGFFLLGRGEFAISLITEADDKIRSRWRRSDNLAYEKRERLGDIVVKDGEVSAVLARTWTAMGALQNANDDEDEQLELARDLISLSINKSTSIATPARPGSSTASKRPTRISSTPFSSLLLSVPTTLTLNIPSPLDLFLTPSEIQTYSGINAYLLSIRRAHLRLTDLWKISSLRRDHPSPPAPPYGSSQTGRAIVKRLRARVAARGRILRSVWATSSAALFLLGETESYFQGEVVKSIWDGFQEWLMGPSSSRPSTSNSQKNLDDDIWASAGREVPDQIRSHDPQTLSDAHRKYLDSLTTHLLLTTQSFTDPLYHLLQQIDHLLALVHRMHSIWQSLDLEADEGVVDAFSDFHKEERDVKEQLGIVAQRVKGAIELLIQALRDIDQEKETLDDVGMEELGLDGEERAVYVPAKVGRVDRLLMKLDFGGWFDRGQQGGGDTDGVDSEGDFDF
jgi:hypothetical protein